MTHRPSRPELLHWRQDKVTQWILENLGKQMPPWPSYLPPKSMEDACINAGQQQVMRLIAKLCEADSDLPLEG